MQGAEFDLTVYVGDPQLKPVKYPIGTITVLQRDGVRKAQPPKPSKRELLYQVQPEITHTHRPISRQPPTIAPLAATAAVLVVLVAWLAVLSKIPLNLSAMPSGGDLVAAVAFHALLAGALAFAVWYWLRMTLIDALLPLAGLAIAMVLVGQWALSILADRRLAKEGKASKSD